MNNFIRVKLKPYHNVYGHCRFNGVEKLQAWLGIDLLILSQLPMTELPQHPLGIFI